jgi:hypothetical protein
MANTIFRGDAKPVAQVVTITPANPEPGDVFTLTINGKSINYTAEEASVADVVDGLVAAWNESTIPEFAEVTAAAVDSDDDDESDYLTLTADTPGVPFEVTASATDGGGFLIVVTTVTAGSPGQNEIQRITIPAGTSGGTFTLTFEGQTTGALDYDFDASEIQTALEGLSNIAAGDVEVTGDTPEWYVEFKQAFANLNATQITGNGASLTGAASLTIATTTQGYASRNEIKSVTVPTASSFTLWNNFSLIATFAAGSLAAVVESYLEVEYGTGNVFVTRETSGGNYVYLIEFIGDLGGQNIVDTNSLQYTIASIDPDDIEECEVEQQGSATAQNEIQTVRINGTPTGGTFTLTFQGQTTAGIAYNANAAAVTSALEALSNIGVGDVGVVLSGTTYTITFQGALAGMDVGQLTGSAASLTGGAVTIVTTQAAIAASNEVQQVTFSQTPGGGTFTLTWNPGGGGETTSSIAYNASASTVQTALEGLTTPAPGDFTVSGANGGPWLVEFKGTYAGTNVAAISGTSSLTGGGSQSVTLATTQRSLGPAHYDDPTNWTNARVPDSGDTIYFSAGRQDCLYGLKQQTTFTAATDDTITVPKPLHLVNDQIVQVLSSNTLPAGLSAATNYYVINADRDAGTLKLSASSGGAAVNITDTGTGTHTMSVVATKNNQANRYSGRIGLPERNDSGDYYEYRQGYLAIAATNIELGGGDGSGSGRIKISTGPFPTNLKIFDTGGGSDTGLPAVLWKGTHASNDVTLIEGELGIAILATETATMDALVLRSGAVFLGTVTIASIERTGGEILADNVTLAGSLQIRG